MPGSNNGTGRPINFRCASCRKDAWRKRGSRSGYAHRVDLTGRLRYANSRGNAGCRNSVWAWEYICQHCGHQGYSRHIDLERKARNSGLFGAMVAAGKIKEDWVGREVKCNPASKIVGVAVRHEGKIFSMPAPARHCDVIRMAIEETNVDTWTGDMHYDQGFIDADGAYLHRCAALTRAYKTGQIPAGFEPTAGILFSEDIW